MVFLPFPRIGEDCERQLHVRKMCEAIEESKGKKAYKLKWKGVKLKSEYQI